MQNQPATNTIISIIKVPRKHQQSALLAEPEFDWEKVRVVYGDKDKAATATAATEPIIHNRQQYPPPLGKSILSGLWRHSWPVLMCKMVLGLLSSSRNDTTDSDKAPACNSGFLFRNPRENGMLFLEGELFRVSSTEEEVE